MQHAAEILNRLREELVAKMHEADRRSMYNPVCERIKLHTSLFPKLLEKYQGKARLTEEFSDELDKLAEEDARLMKEIEDGYDYVAESNKAIDELIDLKIQIEQVDAQIFFTRPREHS
jgi:hypothetical protein